jgi:achilleol B synthase
VRANNSSSSTNSDRSVECTSSVIQALNMFREMYPGYRKEEIEKCIKTASRFIEKEQKNDGSWCVTSSSFVYPQIIQVLDI